MTRNEEIEMRLSEITSRLTPECENLAELESEVRALKDEQRSIIKAEAEKVEERKAVANDEVAVTVLETRKQENTMEKTYAIETMEYRSAWLKNLQGNMLDEVEARAIASSGAAVPTEVSNKFFAKMKKLAPMLSEITLMNVAGNLKFYSESVRDAATVHTENGNITAGANDSMVAVTLGGYEFAKLISISKAASTMSIDAFEGWLVEIISEDLARAIDNYILNDSTNGVAAITYTTGTNQVVNTSTSGYTYKNILELSAMLPAAYDADAKFITNKATLYGKIATIVNSAGNPLFVANPEEGMVGRIMGYPVVVDDYVTTANGALYLGKWKDVIGNMSSPVTVERNENSGFRTGSIDFRGFAIFDSKPAKTDAIVRLVTTA